tara:strand:+ start:413 stop:739 length:327 start_codon:yes stop_codon:yes gene_type:complete
MAVYTDYISYEIAQNLKECEKEPKLNHHFFRTPLEPLIKNVGKVNYGESNYACGPLTKTIYLEDTLGQRYKVSVEDLKHVKGHGWITHEEYNKLNTQWNREEKIYEVV